MGRRTNTAVWLEDYKRWQIKVQKDGKRRTFTSSTPGRTGQREANAKADAWLDDGVEPIGRKVSQIYQSFLDEMKLTTSLSMTLPMESRFKAWINPGIGYLKISSLNEQHMQNIINSAYKAGRSKKTLMNIRGDLTAFLKFCRKSKLTTLIPENLKIPAGAVCEEKKILLPDDLKKLFSCDLTFLNGKETTEELVYAFRFQVLTGLRPGELLGLEWNDIDGDTITIQRSINKYGETTTGKNQNARRTFQLSSIAIEVLEQQKEINRFGRVFGKLTQVKYWQRWKKYCSYNAITETTPYELRHTFVSVSAELPIGMLQPLVGHSKNMDSFGTYGHNYAELRAKTAEKSDQIWKSILKNDDESNGL